MVTLLAGCGYHSRPASANQVLALDPNECKLAAPPRRLVRQLAGSTSYCASVSLKVRPAGADRWDDVAAVLGRRGDPSRCWCQYFRLRGKQWSESDPDSHRAALRSQVVDAEIPPGVLAEDEDGTPVGWCALAPRASYPRVVASPNWRHDGHDPGAWAVTCFVVPVGHRRQGVAGELLLGAVEFARSQGARTLEGCAVDLAEAGRVSSADLYRGPLSVFLAAGFEEISRTSPSWVLVRRSL